MALLFTFSLSSFLLFCISMVAILALCSYISNSGTMLLRCKKIFLILFIGFLIIGIKEENSIVHQISQKLVMSQQPVSETISTNLPLDKLLMFFHPF